MGAGQLRQRVTFERADETNDGAGGRSVHWTAVLTVWGGLAPERGREALAAGRLESDSGAVLTVRSSSATRAITPAHRVTIGGAPYAIRAITNPDQHNRFLELVLERGVAT